ncbi:MAG: murein biosynthesis integral membrane protein MurJ, partial [Acidobacteriota bacterium]|jgi:putative peptidoglycan lipid II flippase|nr:murein biosynthesis integral membrane protein MurJ [Acidobacteriota bacterium]
MVGAGILSSRVLGLVRERVFAHYFGNSDAADVFKAALKIPNLLQNLFGEGALSASFIPVYAGLLGNAGDKASPKDKADADRVARCVGSILAVVLALLVLAGIAASPLLIDLIAPGFEGAKREATIRMVRILFPGVGVLVLSAWCLGILNSHRKFFLPYAAPILWNLAIIGALLLFGGSAHAYDLAEIAAWSAVAGSLLQFGVQLPTVCRLVGRLRFEWAPKSEHLRAVVRNFIPGVATRGVNQLSGYIDEILASFLTTGAVASLAYAQTIYLLPVSLFGMAVSSAELPEMARQTGSIESIAEALRGRLESAMRRVAFFIVPSAAAFLALGDSIVNLLFQTGKFTRTDGAFVWLVLAGSSVGLLASTLGRLYMSAFWAVRDTRTPFRFAALRVALTAGLGWLLAFPVPGWLGLEPRTGLAGLTASAGIAAWVEFALLRRAMNHRIGRTGIEASLLLRLWGAAVIAAAVAFALKWWTQGLPPIVAGPLVLVPFGILYFAAAALFKVPEAGRILATARRRIARRAH